MSCLCCPHSSRRGQDEDGAHSVREYEDLKSRASASASAAPTTQSMKRTTDNSKAANSASASSSSEEDIRAVDWWRTRSQESLQSASATGNRAGTSSRNDNLTPPRRQLSPNAENSWAQGQARQANARMATTESIEVDELNAVQQQEKLLSQRETSNDVLLPINMSPLRASSLPFERTRTEGSSLATSDESDLGFKLAEHEEEDGVNNIGRGLNPHRFQDFRTRTDDATMEEYLHTADANQSLDRPHSQRDELDDIVLGVNNYNMSMSAHETRGEAKDEITAETNRVEALLTGRHRANSSNRTARQTPHSTAQMGQQHQRHHLPPVVSPSPTRAPPSPKRSPTPQEAAAATVAAASHIGGRSGGSSSDSAAPPRYQLQKQQQQQQQKQQPPQGRHGQSQIPVVTPTTNRRGGSGDIDGGGGIDSLSNVPSNVDPDTRDRYLLACRLLKATMIEKDSRLLPDDKAFLRDLLYSAEQETEPSDFDIAKIETASDLLSDSEDEILHPQKPRRFRVASIKEAWQKKAEELFTHRLPSIGTSPQREVNPPGSPAPLPTSGTRAPNTATTPAAAVASPFVVLGKRPNGPPGVFTQPLMEALRGFLPNTKSEENFWLRYELDDHGDSLQSLLDHVQSCTHTIIGVETKEGNVFGAYCASPWTDRRSWFGSKESFLWRLKKSRLAGGGQHKSYDFDNEMEVYPYTGHDDQIQYCTERTLAIGGGQWSLSGTADSNPHLDEPSGIGFMLDEDLMGGETNSCATFANPSLSGPESSNEFDVVSLEVYTLTPCRTVSEATRLEEKYATNDESARTF